MGSGRPTLFLSDQHLSPERPQALRAFHAFCAGPARDAAAVYLLGDLFDWWIGDDQVREPFVAEVVRSLRALADAGVPVFVAHGNRDFLISDRFATATSCAPTTPSTRPTARACATPPCRRGSCGCRTSCAG